jgi:hypothetical protein
MGKCPFLHCQNGPFGRLWPTVPAFVRPSLHASSKVFFRRPAIKTKKELNGVERQEASKEGLVDKQQLEGQKDGSITEAILSDPEIEGDPSKFLKVSEAYWQVGLRTS